VYTLHKVYAWVAHGGVETSKRFESMKNFNEPYLQLRQKIKMVG